MTFPLSLVDQGFLISAFPIVSASENLGKLPALFAFRNTLQDFSEADKDWLPQRLRMNLEDLRWCYVDQVHDVPPKWVFRNGGLEDNIHRIWELCHLFKSVCGVCAVVSSWSHTEKLGLILNGKCATVDGQNPAPPIMMIIPLFIGF